MQKKYTMNTQTYKQTGIRLPEELITVLKKNAKNRGVSFNRYVEYVLNKDAETSLPPYIDPHEKINPDILSMAGTIPMPSQEEIDSDPRLKAALGI